MVVRFLFWLASRTSQQIQLFDFDSGLRLISGKRLTTINANAEHRFLRGEVAVGVWVLSEGDLDAVRGREVGREGQRHAASEAGPVRDGDVGCAFGVNVFAWARSGQVVLDGECRRGNKKARNCGQGFPNVHCL